STSRLQELPRQRSADSRRSVGLTCIANLPLSGWLCDSTTPWRARRSLNSQLRGGHRHEEAAGAQREFFEREPAILLQQFHTGAPRAQERAIENVPSGVDLS